MEVLPCPVSVDFTNGGGSYASLDEDYYAQEAVRVLAKRLEMELRRAHTGEVLLPDDLLVRVATQVLSMADSEPYGIRGCTLFMDFETSDQDKRISIGRIKCASDTVSTFELYLTFKEDSGSWRSILPQFLKNLTRGGTIVLSRDFQLKKKRLFRSYASE